MEELPLCFLTLPLEIHQLVASWLDPVTLTKLGLTCHSLRELSIQPDFWRKFVLSRRKYVNIASWQYDWRLCFIEQFHNVPEYQNRILVTSSTGTWLITPSDPQQWVPPISSEPELQPTWSWDARYVAYLAEPPAWIRVHEISTNLCRDYLVTRAPFFINWSPDCTKLIYLSSDRHSLFAAYIDLRTAIPGAKTDQSITLYRSPGLYFTYSPIPGVDRILANAVHYRTIIMGLNAQYSPSAHHTLSFPPRNGSKYTDLVQETLTTKPSQAFSQISDVHHPDPLMEGEITEGRFSTPFWTACNTMIMVLRSNARSEEILVAFDSVWQPRYPEAEGSDILEIWRTRGVEDVQRIMEQHTIEQDTSSGIFMLPSQSSIVELASSTRRIDFVASPNGRYVLVIALDRISVVEMLYNPPWDDDTEQESHVGYFTDFHPKKLVGSQCVWSDSISAITGVFSPNSRSILFLTQNGVKFQWNSLQFTRPEAKVVSYEQFVQAAFMMRYYYPFFSQYTQSMQMHSPDSTQFTYPADSRIWIQDIHDGEGSPPPPVEVREGSFCSWSPR